MIKLSAVLGHPNMIGVKPIYNEFNLQRYIKENNIVEFEITGVWGESMV